MQRHGDRMHSAVLKWQWESVHPWGTNDRDCVMVRYVTLCENSNYGKTGVNVSPLPIIPRQQQKSRSPGAAWTDLSRVECLALIDLTYVWVPESREDVIFFSFLFLEKYAGGGGRWRGRPPRGPSPGLPLHIGEYPVAGPKTGNSFSPLWMECL